MSARQAAFKKMKRLFVVSAEGCLNEPLYFRGFSPGRDGSFRIKVLEGPPRRSRPLEVVNRLIEFEREHKPGPDTEYWALVDKESCEADELEETWQIIKGRTGFNLAVSNPCFELWLWLHLSPNRTFEDRRHCQFGLAHEWPGYADSNYNAAPFMKNVAVACARARQLDCDPTTPWPLGQGTRVDRLVEQLC